MVQRLRVCFVCLGNICRSPTAEAIFRRMVEDAGLSDRIAIESAGTGAYHVGCPADPRARAHARARGYELNGTAQHFVANDFQRFDVVLAMDAQNLRNLRELEVPDHVQLSLFRHFDPTAPEGASVPDPYHGGDDGFEEVLDQCERASRGLLLALRQRLQESAGA